MSETFVTHRKPDLLTRIAYGLSGAAEGAKNNGFDFFLLIFYSQVLGVDAVYVGLVLLAALFVDGISDPVVGYWSDNLRTRLGRRHPFMYAAIIPVTLVYYFVWNPPASLSGNELLPYLLVLTLAVRLSFTFFEVPSSALAAELTDDYDERTSLLSFRHAFAWFSGLGISFAALILFLVPTEEVEMGFFNLEGWGRYGFWAAVLIFAATSLSTLGTHRHIPHLKSPPPQRRLSVKKIIGEIAETVSNHSFRALFAAALCSYLASGISASLNQYINGFFWGFSTKEIGSLTLAVFASAGLALLIAPIVSKTIGKKRGAIILGLFAFTIAPAPVFARLLGLMPENGTPELFQIILWLTIVDIALIIIVQILMTSMIADVVEESELATGRRSEGIFFAGISFIRKLAQGGGIMAATLVLSMAAIAPGMQPSEVSDASLRKLGMGYGIGVLTVWMLMIACLTFYRISRESHAANLAELAARDTG